MHLCCGSMVGFVRAGTCRSLNEGRASQMTVHGEVPQGRTLQAKDSDGQSLGVCNTRFVQGTARFWCY